MHARDRTETVVLLLVWVLPLLAASALLAAAGLPLVAGALLAVEVVVGLLALAATRRPDRAATPARAWGVPAVMVAVVGGLVVLTVLIARFG